MAQSSGLFADIVMIVFGRLVRLKNSAAPVPSQDRPGRRSYHLSTEHEDKEAPFPLRVFGFKLFGVVVLRLSTGASVFWGLVL